MDKNSLLDISQIAMKNGLGGHAVFHSLILMLGFALAAEQKSVPIETKDFIGVILPSQEPGDWMPSKDQILEAETEMAKHFAKGFVPKLPIVFDGKSFESLNSFKAYFKERNHAQADSWIRSVNEESKKYLEIKKKWAKYKRQYCGKTVGGRRILEVYFLTGDFENWRTELIQIKDGGTDFLNLTYDPKTKKVINVYIHGEA